VLGSRLRRYVGFELGCASGAALGITVGIQEGIRIGQSEGNRLGCSLNDTVGRLVVGALVLGSGLGLLDTANETG
jgi:hypothetical protein